MDIAKHKGYTMEVTSSKPKASFAVRGMKLPLQALWFLVKHPVVALIMALLIAFSSFSFLAHFNPAIGERFNNAVIYFGAATLTSTISDTLRLTERKLGVVSTDLRATKSKLETAKVELDGFKTRKAKFAKAGKQIEKRALRRFTKVAVYGIAREFLGWVPIAGDAASLALTAGGVYEMCQMFKEIEQATAELGVRYKVYTDTFCEKPAEKSAEVLSSFTKTGFSLSVLLIKSVTF